MIPHPVCPAHERAAKVCEERAREFARRVRVGEFPNISQSFLDSEVVADGLAARIRADCLSSGCAERWAKGLELAWELRDRSVWALDSWPLLAALLARAADHIEAKEGR